MKSSFRLFSVRHIDIKIHITFPLILIWAAVQYGILANGGAAGALFGLLTVSLLFVLVTLHELGHSFAAQHYGVPVEQIVLLPIGGVAQLKRMPRQPLQEFVIALAGPAVNVLIALLMMATALLFNMRVVNPLALLTTGFSLSFSSIFSFVFIYNVILAVFNMIPAFPMDGGRVLRALLAMRLEYGRATRMAVAVGRALAWAMGIYGLVSGNFFMMLIAFFIHNGAAQEGRLVAQFERLRGLKVYQAYSNHASYLSPYDTLQQAMMLKMSSLQDGLPVVHAGQLIGFVEGQALVQAFVDHGGEALVQEVMSRNIRPVGLNTELVKVQEQMQNEQTAVLPVVNGTEYLGLITLRHINQLVRTLRLQPEVLTAVPSA